MSDGAERRRQSEESPAAHDFPDFSGERTVTHLLFQTRFRLLRVWVFHFTFLRVSGTG